VSRVTTARGFRRGEVMPRVSMLAGHDHDADVSAFRSLPISPRPGARLRSRSAISGARRAQGDAWESATAVRDLGFGEHQAGVQGYPPRRYT